MTAASDVSSALEREQRDDLALWRSLTSTEWHRPSLCKGWSVKDVMIHTIIGERDLFQPNVRRALAGDSSPLEAFELEHVNDEQIAAHRGRTPADLIGEAEEIVAATHKMLGELNEHDWVKPSWNPIAPGSIGFYVKGRIWEWWTHGQDVRIPLKRPGGTDPERTTPVVEVIRDGISAVFLPDHSKGVHVSYAFQVGTTGFTVRIDDGRCVVDSIFDPKATSRVKADPATFALVGTRRVSQMRAVLTRKFKPSGNPIAGLKFLSYFRSA